MSPWHVVQARQINNSSEKWKILIQRDKDSEGFKKKNDNKID